MAMSIDSPVKVRLRLNVSRRAQLANAFWSSMRWTRDALGLLAGATVLAWLVVTFSK